MHHFGFFWNSPVLPLIFLSLILLFQVASKLEVFPGAEFRVAYEEAMKYGGKVILGDRPVQVTTSLRKILNIFLAGASSCIVILHME